MAEPIGPISYEGLSFRIPVGISAIWDDAGKYFTTTIYHIESKNRKPPMYVQGKNVGGDGGAPLPPLIPATEKDRNEWQKKWHGQVCQVERFKLNPAHLPSRDYILELAEHYGMEQALITKFRTDGRIDNEEIVKAINDLPVPDAIRFPEIGEEDDEDESDNKEDT